MPLSSSNVYLLGPDQATATGAIMKAALGATMPTNARTTLSGTWTDSGYVSESGVTLNISRSTAAIKDWGINNVRIAYTDFGVTVNFEFLSFDEFAAKAMFGDSNVTVTPATSTAGEILLVNVTAEMPDACCWVFNMKDGDRRARLAIPNGQITEVGSPTFVKGSANVWPVTITCMDDGNGTHIKVITDDGEFSA